MQVAVVSLFPGMFRALTEFGVTGRAVGEGQLQLLFANPRDHALDRHRSVDDRPYGGGPGMLMKLDTLVAALQQARQALDEAGGGVAAEVADRSRRRTIYLSPQGRPLDQTLVRELAALEQMVLVAGRYEGVDERFIESEVDEEVSIGDYVLSGGELPAMVLLDAVCRQLPGVLGHEQSAAQDSFASGLLDCPHYTRPEEYQGRRVPQVLLSGNHEEIRRWRLQQALARTLQRRPDLLEGRVLTEEEDSMLRELRAAIEPAGDGRA
ncbi:MAG: tRNA (guanosine(37)-N1)-methyltransferase TrmD [Halieaceae bacterium]|nr:tRNA (guanosine(37)-N1)-methyltransferase TrmD [Halieaceae bacterium]